MMFFEVWLGLFFFVKQQGSDAVIVGTFLGCDLILRL